METEIKKIYLEPLWKMHSLYNSLILYPPDGYEFIIPQTLTEKTFKAASKIQLSYFLLHKLHRIVPVELIKSHLERFKKVPKGTALTYSSQHLVFRHEPWVVDLEYISILLGNSKHFKRYKGVIERAFASEYCKKILCWYEAAKRTILSNLDCTQFEHKIEVLLLYGQKRNFIKQFHSDKIKLLFVGSANILGEFEIKGGAEVIETFLQLSRKYDNLELVIRSDMPQDMKKKCSQIRNLRVIDNRIPWEQLEQEFKSADIFLLPAHNTPWLAFLDAMSYQLPVITIDAWANSEIVEDGKTGFTVKKSDRLQYYSGNFLPNWDSPQFNKAIRTADPKVVEEVVEKVSLLVENKELRRRMGRAGRHQIETGKFSIKKRNEKLKRIFDEATANTPC